MDNNAITEIVTQYMAAWNEPDDTARRALLEQCWSNSGVYLDPNVSLAGRDALAMQIGKVLAGRPKDLDDAAGLWRLHAPKVDAERIRRTLRLLEEALGQSDLVSTFDAIARPGSAADPRE